MDNFDDLIEWLEQDSEVQAADFDKLTAEDLNSWIEFLVKEMQSMRDG